MNGEPDPKTVDVISRFYTRVKQEYLNPGIPEGRQGTGGERTLGTPVGNSGTHE